MSKKYLIIWMAVVLTILIGGIFVYFKWADNFMGYLDAPVETPSSSPTPGQNLSGTPGPVIFTGQILAGTESPLLDFNRADYDKALATDKLIVLYFYADWCPYCEAETMEALYPAFNELKGNDVVGFRVNFNDTHTDIDEKFLAREHGITYQHSKVFIKDVKRKLKSPEIWDKERYLKEINIYK